MINMILLGTAAMVPTKERNVSSIYLEYKGEGMLFDCGEGTQRQMNIAGISRAKIKKVFISHWHGDHVSGLIGLLQTISNSADNPSITIFGPKETKERMSYLLKSTYFGNLSEVNLRIEEISTKKLVKIFENNYYYVEAIPLEHGIPSLGYNFVEKDRLRINITKVRKIGMPEGPLLGKLQLGKSIVFKGKKYSSQELTNVVKGKKASIVMDTLYTKNILELAKDADLMISEATYLDKHEEKGEGYKHMTVKQAAQAAHRANAKKLVLIHFSQRYKDTNDLKDEAKSIFPNSHIGYDFMKLKL